MKNHLNIKMLLITMFSLMCFFIIDDKVEANFVCYYKDPLLDLSTYGDIYDPTINELVNGANIYVRLNYEDDGRIYFNFYDSVSKKTHTRITAVNNDSIDYYISFKRSGIQLTDDDFKNGCPNELDRITFWPPDAETGQGGVVYDIFKSGTEEYENFYNKKMEDSVWKYKNDSSKCYLPNDQFSEHRKVCNKIRVTNLPGTVDQNVTDGKILTCSYVDVDLYIDDHDITPDMTLKISYADKTISGSDYIFNMDAKYNFVFDDVSNTCPNRLYYDTTNNTFYLKKGDVPSGNDTNVYGLIKHLKYEEIEGGEGKTGCELIGEKNLKFIRKIYTLLRFLVPIIIIVFSVIDFASVVISGENDKMEKAKNKFIKRLLIGIIILFIPIVLEILLKLIGILKSNEKLVDIVCSIT